MKLFGLTDTGLVRRENQDSYAIRELDSDLAIAVVCDGMGGAQAGNVASAVAVEAFSAALESSCREGLPPDRQSKEELMRAACRTANAQVYRLSCDNPEYRGMGTTLVAALVLSHEIYIVNVGDSRGYIWHGGALTQITSDHSLVQAMVDRGDITQESARTHPKKNLITRALGIEETVKADVYCVERGEGSVLLLCSDGLSNVLPDKVLQAELARKAPPDAAARRLLALSVEQGAPDNVTVILAQL